MRRMMVTLALVGAFFLSAPPAHAQKSFSLPDAKIDVKVTKTGTGTWLFVRPPLADVYMGMGRGGAPRPAW